MKDVIDARCSLIRPPIMSGPMPSNVITHDEGSLRSIGAGPGAGVFWASMTDGSLEVGAFLTPLTGGALTVGSPGDAHPPRATTASTAVANRKVPRRANTMIPSSTLPGEQYGADVASISIRQASEWLRY